MRILIVDDNVRLAEKMRQLLKRRYVVEVADSGDEALALLTKSTFDLLVLDLNLPDTSGLELCRLLRKQAFTMPVIIVTGVNTTSSRVELLGAGADDYITKPFEPPELLARVQALLRRSAERTQDTSTLTVGDLVIDVTSRTITRANTPINLRRKEFDILEYLCKNKGRVMTRQMIINHAWSSTSDSWTGSVDVHIKQLRDKVDKPFAYPLIKTTYGVGYMVEL